MTWTSPIFSMDFALACNVFASGILILMALALLLKKNNTAANRLLATLLLYPVFTMAFNTICVILGYHRYVFMGPVHAGVALTFGPVVLAYIRLLQGRKIPVHPRHLLHFLPALAALPVAGYYLTLGNLERRIVLENMLAGKDPFTNVFNLLLSLHLAGYLFAAWREVRKYARSARKVYSDLEEVEVQWSRTLVLTIFWLNVFLLLTIALPIVVTGEANVYGALIGVPVLTTAFYAFLLHGAFSRHVIFDRASYLRFVEKTGPLNTIVDAHEKNKHGAPSVELGEEALRQIKERIETLFENEKVHARPGFKLHDLARQLDMNPESLPGVLHACFQASFYEIINRRRVEDIQKWLCHPDGPELSEGSLREKSGFNSEDALRSEFRKHAGCSLEEARRDARLYDRVKRYFDEERPHLNPSLKISDVAEALKVPGYLLSRALNRYDSSHFFDFVNSLRVLHARRLMETPEQLEKYSLEGIARESGFANRTTFSTAFKKFAGCTPQAYKQNTIASR